MKEHYEEIDILRGIAISLVILGHAIIVFPINLHEVPWCSFLFTWLSSVHMPLFFAISGFCYSIGKRGYRDFIIKKVKRLLIPYLSMGCIEIGMKVAMPSIVNHQRTLGEGIKNIFLSGGGVLVLIYAIFDFFDFSIIGENLSKKQICLCCN